MRIVSFILAASLLVIPRAHCDEKEFTDELVRDFSLRSVGLIQLTNLRGSIVVQGWSQDRIRVRARRRVFAADEASAKSAFSAMDFLFQESDGRIELSAQYGRGLKINERVQEREKPVELQSKMDMTVYAPSESVLKIWTDSGISSLKNWNNSAELRTVSGDIFAENIKGAKISSLCQNCSAKFRGIKGSIRAIADGGNLSIKDVEGANVFLDTAAGNVDVQNVRGEQIYVTKTGKITAHKLQGHVEFQSQKGSVDISSLRGFASGKTDSGAISLQAEEWEFDDKALIESNSGAVSLWLPKTFAAEVDLKSNHGKVECEFPIHRAAVQSPEPGHLLGRIGEESTDLLKVFSDTGNVQIGRLAL